MTSFSRQKPLISKIQKHTIVGNTKVYYRAKSQLKRLKIEKLFWESSLCDDSWPAVLLGKKFCYRFFVKDCSHMYVYIGDWYHDLTDVNLNADFKPTFLLVVS